MSIVLPLLARPSQPAGFDVGLTAAASESR